LEERKSVLQTRFDNKANILPLIEQIYGPSVKAKKVKA